jgi:hypothetical protein
VERNRFNDDGTIRHGSWHNPDEPSAIKPGYGGYSVTTIRGWQPTCDCPGSTPTRRPLVLDPFNGSGTTGDVARLAGCDYVGCELNPEYAALSRKRWEQATLL